MFGKSYSDKALTLAINAMRIVDENINFDFMDHRPTSIPDDHEWQIHGLKAMFDGERKKKAAQRVAFNHGLLAGVAQHFFDGSGSDFDKFLKKAVIEGAYLGKQVAKDLGKTERKYPSEFNTGFQYAKGFIQRHIK